MSKIESNFLETELRTGAWVLWSWASALPENPVREGVKQERQGADAVSEKAHRYLRPRGRGRCGPGPSTELVLPGRRLGELGVWGFPVSHWLRPPLTNFRSEAAPLLAHSFPCEPSVGKTQSNWGNWSRRQMPPPQRPPGKAIEDSFSIDKKLQDKTSRAVREEARPCQNHRVLIPEVRRSLLTTHVQKRLLRGQREAMSKECST